MKPVPAISVDEIRSMEAYAQVRGDLLQRVLALKKHRRIPVGARVSFVFENRETLLWQIHEMMRVERITDRDKLRHECEVYSELLPNSHELSATLFFEMPQGANIRAELDRMIGMDEHTYLVVGSDVIRAQYDPGHSREDRIAAVQYVRFALSDAQRAAFLDERVPVAIRMDHPEYKAESAIAGETRRALCEDLRQ